MKRLIVIPTLLLCLYGLPASAQETISPSLLPFLRQADDTTTPPEIFTPPAQDEAVITSVVPLRYADSRGIVRQLQEGGNGKPGLPADLSLIADARTNSVILTGSIEAIVEVTKRIKLLDVSPIQIRLEMRVIRLIHEKNGALKIETVGGPTATTLDRVPAMMSALSKNDGIPNDGYIIEINPQVQGDGTILLIGKLSVAMAGTMKSSSITRVVADGSTLLLMGVTNSTNKETQRAVQHGELSVTGN